MSSVRPERLTVLHVNEVTWGGVVTLLDHFLAEQVRAGDRVHLLTPDSYPTDVPGVVLHRIDASELEACRSERVVASHP